PVLAQNQNGQLGIGHAANCRAEGLDRRALADELHALFGRVGNLPAGREELLPLLRILQGDRRVRRQLGQTLLIVRREITANLIDQLKRTEQVAVLSPQWHAQQRTRLEAQLLIDAAVDLALLGRDVGIDAPWLAAANHLT